MFVFFARILFIWTFAQLCVAQPTHFISIADIHFNPFADCKTLSFKPCPLALKLESAPISEWLTIFKENEEQSIPGRGHDSNFALLQSALNELHIVNVTEKPAFALVLGDFFPHNFRTQYMLYLRKRDASAYQQFAAKTMAFLTQQISSYLSNIPVYPVIGNNDTYSGNYHTSPNSQFFKDTAAAWQGLSHDQPGFKKSFRYAGYYAINLNANKLVVLNTVLFSRFATKLRETNAAHMQLIWLQQQLSAAAKNQQQVIIAMHIPMGIDLKSTLKYFFGGVREYWQPAYTAQFRELLNKYSTTVTGILAGHVHQDFSHLLGFRLPAPTPLYFTPSISPIFGNSPSFKLYLLNEKNLTISSAIDYTINQDGVWLHDTVYNL